jgi:ketosteroid isomerase-like protein
LLRVADEDAFNAEKTFRRGRFLQPAKEPVMNDLISLIDSYIDIWNEPDTSYRRALIARVWTEDARYVDPLMQGDGHEGIDAMVQAVQERFPRHRFRRIGNVDAFQDRVRFAWSLAPLDPAAPGSMRAQGSDFGVLRDGRLQRVTGFLDPVADQPQPQPRGWSVDRFAAFWKKPDLAQVAPALTPDVVGYWPGSDEPVRGIADYTQRIADLIALVPDFRLDVAEHAVNDNCVFIRWIAHGSFEGKPLEFGGVDRVRMRDGLVAENRIYCDHPLIHALARHGKDAAPALSRSIAA